MNNKVTVRKEILTDSSIVSMMEVLAALIYKVNKNTD